MVIQAAHEWPPDYAAVIAWRQSTLARLETQPELIEKARAYYRTHPVEFICGWVDTFDPRKAATGEPAWMPFILFKRQAEFIEFVLACLREEANGLTEKSRDMGITWAACALSVWLWLFEDGASVGWGSRHQHQVDRLGDTDSIFEKMRQIIVRLPRVFWPKELEPDKHLYHMRLINPENGNTITGEIGPNIGRGGRKLIYFKDESAHYEHPEMIEASLMDNTRVQLDISSVNGVGNVFHRKREAGVDWEVGQDIVKGQTNVFVMDWSTHPDKTEEWYERRKVQATAEGLQHIFAQEVDRNYSASVIGTIIAAEWIKAAIDAHIKLGFEAEGAVIAALDVADEGADTNALAIRTGVVLQSVEEWGERDTALTARRAVTAIADAGPRTSLWYDAIGIGAGVKAETNRLKDEKLLPPGMTIEPWFASATPLHPEQNIIAHDYDTPKNKDFYANLKAQGWWELRNRFERTYRAVVNGEEFQPDELISLPSKLPQLSKLCKELSQPTAGTTSNMKLTINKRPDGTKSPNLADAVMMAYWPATTSTYDATLSWVGEG